MRETVHDQEIAQASIWWNIQLILKVFFEREQDASYVEEEEEKY